MLYAVLACSSRSCDLTYEGWGEAAELEAFECEECGSPLRIVAFANAERDGVTPGSPELQQRHAA